MTLKWTKVWRLTALLIVVPMSSAWSSELPALSVEDVASLRSAGELAISPDGRHIAYALSVPRVAGDDEDGAAWSELHVIRGGDASRGFVTGEVNVGAIAWTPDGSAITFLAKRGEDEEKGLYRIAFDGGEAEKLLEHGDGISEYAWSADGKTLAFLSKPEISSTKEDLQEKGFKQKVFEEEWRPVEAWLAAWEGESFAEPRRLDLDGSASEISFSPSGDRLAVALAPTSLIDDHYMKRRIHMISPGSGEILGIVETSGKLGRVAWNPDGSRLAIIAGAGQNDPDSARLMLVSSNGGEPENLAADLAADAIDAAWLDAETLVWIQARGVERSVVRQQLGSEPSILLEEGGPIWTRLRVAADSLALTGNSSDHPSEVFRASADGGDAARLTDSNPWLEERKLASQEVVEFEARDGLRLQGILLRPLGAAASERSPLVLIVHGGPEAHFANGWLTAYSRPGQVLAGKGYAVFYPNYRGSTGRGLDFALASQGDPAGKEFEDLIDAVDHLIATGLVDRDRVGITGGSYGGYATAWGSTYYSDRFAAGVMFVGISEKIAKLGTSDIPNELYLVHARMWPWENWQKMLERSPVYYVEKAKTPLLILGGDADPRVHPSQSLALYRYLKILGRAPVRYVIYPGEEHGNRKAAARLDYSLRLIRWLDHYLVGPGGEPPPHELDYGLPSDEEDTDVAASEPAADS